MWGYITIVECNIHILRDISGDHVVSAPCQIHIKLHFLLLLFLISLLKKP